MYLLDETFLFKVAPRFSGADAARQAEIISAIAPLLAPILAKYEINTRLRIAHFIAQVCHECAGFRTTEEYASGEAYEGRIDLGNSRKGDGCRYKGRGLIQLTGRANYRAISERLGLDLERDPLLAAEPMTALNIACEYWTSRQINLAADRDDLVRATRLVNGGLNGLEDRRHHLQRAKSALAGMAAAAMAATETAAITDKAAPESRTPIIIPAPAPIIVLRRGSTNDAVGDLQTLLQSSGFLLAVDNQFGPATELAVASFQKAQGLIPDGIVGAKTWAALRAASQSQNAEARMDRALVVEKSKPPATGNVDSLAG